MLRISTDNLTKATQTMGDVYSAGIGIDWLDWTLHRIHGNRECLMLFQKVATFRTQVKEEEAYLHQSDNLLKQAKESLAKKKASSTSTMNYQIKIL